MLHFSRRQRRGLVILSGLIMISLSFPLIWPQIQEQEVYSFSEFELAIEEATKKEEQIKSKTKPEVKPTIEIQLFKFNPNTCSKDDFIKLGLSEKQSQQIINYRLKKGKFYKKSDFKKIYAIDETSYSRLEAYIDIPSEPKPKQEVEDVVFIEETAKKESIYYTIKLELNSANENELIRVDWIGEFLSREIPKYRKALGGFTRVEQLLEVNGLKKEHYVEISKQLKIDKSKIVKLSINFIRASELEKHPYFSKNIAKSIMIERSKNGRYKSIEDLKTRLKFEEDFIDQVKLYLEF